MYRSFLSFFHCLFDFSSPFMKWLCSCYEFNIVYITEDSDLVCRWMQSNWNNLRLNTTKAFKTSNEVCFISKGLVPLLYSNCISIDPFWNVFIWTFKIVRMLNFGFAPVIYSNLLTFMFQTGCDSPSKCMSQ